MTAIEYINGVAVEMSAERFAEFEASRADLNRKSVPFSITRMQLITALTIQGLITSDEAVKSNFEVPAGILVVIDNLPEDQRVAAKIKWLNFTEALRNDELVAALGVANNMSSEDIDNFFTFAGSL